VHEIIHNNQFNNAVKYLIAEIPIIFHEEEEA
jgi:hypothetical protein